MANIIIPKVYWDIKPPVGSQINWGHPLAQGLVGCWLMNEGGGKRLQDLYSNSLSTMNTGVIEYISTPKGMGVKFNGDIVDCGNNPKTNFTLDRRSFSIYFLLKSNSNTDLVRYFHRPEIASTRGWQIVQSAASGVRFEVVNASGGRAVNITTPDAYFLTTKYESYLLTFRDRGGIPAQSDFQVSRNGGLFFNTDHGNLFAVSATPNLSIGGRIGTGNQVNANILFAMLWERRLGQSEARALYEAPYQFIQPRVYRFYSVPVGVSANVLTRRRVFLSCS